MDKPNTPKINPNLFINGQFVKSLSGKTFETLNPADESVLAVVEKGSKEDIDAAVKAARQAFDNGPWPRMDPTQRAKLMYKLADLVERHQEELGILEAMDNGKPAKVAKEVDVKMVHQVIRYYAGWADKIKGSTVTPDGPYFAYTKKQPVGVVGQIIPWNFPLAMFSWKISPALAAGCTIVIKPASQTPLTALRVAELFKEAGFPDGVLNVVPGPGEIGEHLACHPDVDKIAFTGSTAVGLKLMQKSHKQGLKRVTLELGGKSANIITKNADMKTAVEQAVHALFYNAGQCCVAGSRTFVHESIYDQFLQEVTKKVQNIKVGDPLDPQTEQGPMVSKEQFETVMKYIQKGVKQGAKLVTGGKKIGDKGFFIEPAIFADVTDEMTIAKQQIFGPVMCILKYSTNEEVIKRANSSEYGLGAGVVTENARELQWFVDRFKSGTVYVNCYNVLQKSLPFGGYKDSGIGRELGEEGLNNYLETKTVIVKK